MRAKVMLLTASQREEEIAAYAEQILIDLSAAFDHSFSLMREKIGADSSAAGGEALTDPVFDACQQCQAVFACDANAAGVQELYDALNLPMSIRCFSVPESLCGRHEAPVCLYMGVVLSLDEDTLRQAMQTAFQFSLDQDCRLCVVPPNGGAKADWEAAVRVQEAQFTQVSAVTLSAPEAIAQMITAPERMGFVLCPPYAGSILLSAATALSAHPEVQHDVAFDGDAGVYSVCLPPEEEPVMPFSAALALAKLLRFSLHLQKEAACLEAAVNNVLSTGGRAQCAGDDESGGKEALDRICEQISVAGELMQRGGIG